MIRRKPRPDPVTQQVAIAVLTRDGGCVAPRLGGSFMDCGGRSTLDHVKDEPMMGRRAPSDERHLVTLCEYHHLWSSWATSHRPELRVYLQDVNGEAVQADPYPASLL